MPKKRREPATFDLDNLTLDRGDGAPTQPRPTAQLAAQDGAAAALHEGDVDAVHAAMAGVEDRLQTGVSEVLEAFKKGTKGELATRDANVDSRFWVALAFQSEEHKREFLRKSGWDQLGDYYLCGEEVATHMGIPMQIPIPGMPKWKVKSTLQGLASTDLKAE